ncbi:hypothetical protein NQ318_004798, partial [Aromia moschata]
AYRFQKTDETSVPIAVRIHKTLELADDKFYVIKCGKAGYTNTRNETSLVSLHVVDDAGRRVTDAIVNRPYKLRAEISRPDGAYSFRVKSCFVFNKLNGPVYLIDDRGCPLNKDVISPFSYDDAKGVADAKLRSIFKFAEPSDVHIQVGNLRNESQTISVTDLHCGVTFMVSPSSACYRRSDKVNRQISFPRGLELRRQSCGFSLYNATGSNMSASRGACEVAPCRENCPLPSCSGDGGPSRPLNTNEGVLIAATTVFVLDPAQAPLTRELCDEGEINPSWLLWLAVALGVLFLLMLIINIFLCSAMTCACARTEIIEKEPSIIEDYDPYRSWHGSQYGSRYSLNGAPQHPKGYTSGGSTMNSTRSVSSHSDHYAIVHSRPGSRSYNKHRGPPSHMGSHYSGK